MVAKAIVLTRMLHEALERSLSQFHICPGSFLVVERRESSLHDAE